MLAFRQGVKLVISIGHDTIEAYTSAISRFREMRCDLIGVYRRLHRHHIRIAVGHVVLGEKSFDVSFMIGSDFARFRIIKIAH